jgi:hypothetical protein
MAIFNIGDRVYFNKFIRTSDDRMALMGTVLSFQYQLVVNPKDPIYIDRYRGGQLTKSSSYEAQTVVVDVSQGSYSKYELGDLYVIADPYTMGFPMGEIVNNIVDGDSHIEFREKSIDCDLIGKQITYKVRGQCNSTSKEEEVYTFRESQLFYL